VIKIPTEINLEKLVYWTEQIPDCRRFLNNFFRTCEALTPKENYLNYMYDLKIYSPTHKHIRSNITGLVQAFYEITGYNNDGR